MKIFIDTANLSDIENALKRGFIRGITTNPSLLAKEPKSEFKSHIGKIVDLIKRYSPETDLSVEVFSKDPEEILKQAHDFKESFRISNLSIKVQIGWNELEVIHRLSKESIAVNMTCGMSVTQVIMAAAAGAKYVSLFWGRIRDGGRDEKFLSERQKSLEEKALLEEDFDPVTVVGQARALLGREYPKSEIIAGSMRSVADIKQAALAGAHIVTVPPKFFPGMVSHFKTDEVVQQFLSDFSKWLS